MRAAVLFVSLVVACSQTSSPQITDGGVDFPPSCGRGNYPCCIFVTDAAADPYSCPIDNCMLANPDAAPACECAPGYACAIICPSPNGGCGGAPTCCPLP